MVVAASILGQGFHFGFSDTDAQWGKIHNLFFELNTYSTNLSQNECISQKYLVSSLINRLIVLHPNNLEWCYICCIM